MRYDCWPRWRTKSTWIFWRRAWKRGIRGGVRIPITTLTLSGVDLSDADLSHADLRGANLISAHLMNVDPQSILLWQPPRAAA